MKYGISMIMFLLLFTACKEKSTTADHAPEQIVEVKEELVSQTQKEVAKAKEEIKKEMTIVDESTEKEVVDVKNSIKKEALKPVEKARPTEKPSKKATEKPTSKPVVTDDSSDIASKDTKDPTGKPAKSSPTANPVKEVKPVKPTKPEVAVKGTGSPTHRKWDSLLSQYVSNTGNVDYKGLSAKKTDLEPYLKELEGLTPQPSWSEEEELAYWINAYNAYTVKLILDNYPLKSITDLHGGKPWDVKWINIADKTYSLNNIENDIIRPKFNEPRIHFAVNCAAQSCPPLANKAFTFDNLESLLTKQSKAFVNNTKYNTLSSNKITVSEIFKWYESDFGNVATFVSRYADTNVSPTAKVDYMPYDWSLNGK